MTPALYAASVPVFKRYLANLAGMLRIAQAHALQVGQDPEPWLQKRLAPDMLPLVTQIEIAANFSLRATFPLASKPVVPFGEFPPSFAGLNLRLADASAQLDSLSPTDFDGDAARLIEELAGQAKVRLMPAEFLYLYALPNFFFHTSMAYAILRAAGVPLGKGDFDGIHHYTAA